MLSARRIPAPEADAGYKLIALVASASHKRQNVGYPPMLILGLGKPFADRDRPCAVLACPDFDWLARTFP